MTVATLQSGEPLGRTSAGGFADPGASRFESPPTAGTFGKRITSVAVGRFFLTETLHGAGLRLDRHAHELASFNLVLTGSVFEHIAAGDVTCSPGSLLIKPGGAYHENRYGTKGARSLLIECANDTDLGAGGVIPSEFRYVAADKLGEIGAEIMREIRTADVASRIIVEGLVLQLIGLALRQPPSRAGNRLGHIAERVYDRVRDSFSPEMSLEALAASESIDSPTLEAAFRERYGRGIGECVRDARIEWAAGQLMQTREVIGRIAVRAGFYDQSHFSRHFSRKYGIPPGRYRRLTASRP